MSPPHFDLSIIVPTYKEAENLPVLVPRVDQVTREAGLNTEILILDDNSPDATPAVCEQLSHEHPVRLIVRTANRGLSPAVIDGMKAAQGTILLVMDADLSHPPEKIPELVAALQQGDTDFVIGSRYVEGGEVEDNWGLFRQLNSSVAGWMARPLTTARDPMAGFFALKRDRFEEVQDKLNPIGYKIGLELLVKADCQTVREVPILFQDRQLGESKLNLKEQLNYIRHLARLMEYKYPRLVKLFKFGLVGLSGMAVDLLLFFLLLKTIPLEIARALTIWLAMTWNFFGNRLFTFAESREASLPMQYLRFCGSCLLGAGVNYGISVALAKLPWFSGGRELLAAMAGIAAGFLFNFWLCNTFVFQKKSPPENEGVTR